MSFPRFPPKKKPLDSHSSRVEFPWGVQLAELRFWSNGQVVDLSGALASNEGSSPSNEGAERRKKGWRSQREIFMEIDD